MPNCSCVQTQSNTSPLVTVIVPCYNVARWVEQCLKSVLSSTYKNVEVIVVDDGSTDDTAHIISRFATESRVKIISQENRGVSAARNAGLDVARGDFLVFLDADDWVEPDYLADVVRAMEETSADLLVSDLTLIVERTGEASKTGTITTHMPDCDTIDQVVHLAISGLVGISTDDIAAWNAGNPLRREKIYGGIEGKAYRLALLKKHHVRFNERIYMKEDVYFNLHYLSICKSVHCLHDGKVNYRIRADRSNAVANIQATPRETVEAKMLGLAERDSLREEVLVRTGIDIYDAYCGSIALSVLEVGLACASDHKLGYVPFHSYIAGGGRCSALSVPVSFRNAKFMLPVLLVRWHMEALLWVFLRALVRLGIDKKLVNGISEN